MAVIYVGVAWLVGMAIGAIVDSFLFVWLGVGACGVIGIIVFRNDPAGRLGLAVVAALSLGAARSIAASGQAFSPEYVSYYNGLGPVQLTGVVASEPQIYDKGIDVQLRSERIVLPETGPRPVDGYVLIRAGRFPVIEYGDRLLVEGNLRRPNNDPVFNRREYLARQGIFSRMEVTGLTILAEKAGNPISQIIYDFKEHARNQIGRMIPDPQAALLTGILLGDDSGIPPRLDEQFQQTGMSHIIAISGFNIAILTGLLLAVSRPLLGIRRSTWFVLAGIGLYTFLVGADAAVVRAAIMGVLLVTGTQVLGRPTFAPAGLFSAAFFMTLVNPNILWDIGFQLSFAATLGLMLFVPPWSQWAQTHFRRLADPEIASRLTQLLAEIVLATIAAMTLTLPLLVYHFERLSLISLLANLFILPAQPGVMIWGGLATLSGLLVPAIGQLLAWVAWIFLSYTIALVRIFATMPGASVPLSVSPLGLVSIYGIIFAVYAIVRMTPGQRERMTNLVSGGFTIKVGLSATAMVTILLLAFINSQPSGRLEVSFFDVGQGDATFIETPSGRQILVDGSAYPTVLADQLGREMPFWDRHIDLVIATHSDTDHINGLPDVFKNYRVDRLITGSSTSTNEAYIALLNAATDGGAFHHQVSAGETMLIGDGVQLQFLNPVASTGQPATSQHDNDASVALRITYGDFSLLMTGDAGEAAERDMVKSGHTLKSIVYKAGHHGARTSSTLPFLEVVDPDYIVVSAGDGNRYGHPSQELLNKARLIGAAVLRTDELGTIRLSSDGKAVWWHALD